MLGKINVAKKMWPFELNCYKPFWLVLNKVLVLVFIGNCLKITLPLFKTSKVKTIITIQQIWKVFTLLRCLLCICLILLYIPCDYMCDVILRIWNICFWNLTLLKNISSLRIMCIQNGASKKSIKREQIFLMSHICSLIHIN